MISSGGRRALAVAMTLGLAVVYIPLIVVVINSFNKSRTFGWPPSGFTFDWWSRAWQSSGMRTSLVHSIQAGFGATAVALVLGTMAAFAVSRYRFFGRETVSLLVLLPIALPGIVTGIALNNAFRVLGVPFGLLTIIIGHATFCIVLVYNNAIARLRRTARSYEEASADLGAHVFQTFRFVTFPALRSALLAGALLAFALSFDEVIVTIFTAGGVKTLPIWIFQSFRLANQVPLVNVAGLAAILLSVIPVYLATRLSGGVVGARG